MEALKVETILLGSERVALPAGKRFHTFYPQTYYPRPGLVAAVKEMGGKSLVYGFGYGSAFNSEVRADSFLTDIMMVVTDLRDFHRHNTRLHWLNYGTTSGVWFHERLNKYGISFYTGELPLEGQALKVKVGVVGHDRFLHDARGSLRHRGALYLAGRLQKARIIPLVAGENIEQQHEVDDAINQARLDGLWLALALVDNPINLQRLKEKYTGISYEADSRIEVRGKHKLLVRLSSDDYRHMFQPLIERFLEEGILALGPEADTLVKRYSLARKDVEALLRDSARTAFMRNYIINPLTFGILRGIFYAVAKIRKASTTPAVS